MSDQERLTMPPGLRILRWLWLLPALFWSLLSVAAEPGDISVLDAKTRTSGDVLLLDAGFSIRLSKGVREALDNGIPLTFELQVQLVKKHPWLWDVVEAEHVLERQLEYHALSRSYLVRNAGSSTPAAYSRLDDALTAAGSIERLLVTSSPLDEDRKYYIRLRGSLDIETLPTPVRLLAYVSSDWDMNGEWSVWPLER